MADTGWSSDPTTDSELRKKYGPSIHEPCAKELRKYKIMNRSIARALAKWIPASVLTDCTRGGGDAVCESCQLLIREHPEVSPTFHLMCDHKIIKV